MSDTPARDALGRAMDEEFDLLFVLANPDLVVAALIESDWRPDDDQLRAMGGIPTTMVRTVAGTLPLREPALWQFPKEATDGE